MSGASSIPHMYAGKGTLQHLPGASFCAAVIGGLRVKHALPGAQPPEVLEAQWDEHIGAAITAMARVWPRATCTFEVPGGAVTVDGSAYGSIEPLEYFCDLIADAGWLCYLFFEP